MLLWARWMDSSGQVQSKVLVQKFRAVAEAYPQYGKSVEIVMGREGAADILFSWEKGHFYLGRHYNMILKTERVMPPTKRPQTL